VGTFPALMHRRATTLLILFALLVVPFAGGSALADPQSREHLRSTADATRGGAAKKQPALVQPTRPDALSRALDAARITPARYALERVRSLFSLQDVRTRFGRVTAPDPRSATMLIRDLRLRLDQLSPAQRAIARRILARPTDGFPDFYGYTVPEAAPYCPTAVHVCVHYVATTDDAPPGIDASAKLHYVEATSDVLEEVWAKEIVDLGYRQPKSDVSSHNSGPNGKLDVYLVDIGNDGIFGYCDSDDPHLDTPAYHYWDMSAYCVLDNDYSAIQFGMDPLDALRVTAAHEFFHAVQFAYDFADDAWFMEGTATWIEDVVYDDIDDNLRYLPSGPIGQPTIPLDRNTGFRIYGTWIFWRFLAEYFGGATPANGIVRQVWNKADGSPVGPDRYSTQAAALTVAQQSVNGTPWKLRWAFADFGVWNLRPGKFYDEGTSYPAPSIARTLTLTRAAPSYRSTASLDHLSNRAVALRRGSKLAGTARLRIVVNGPLYGTGPEASALVIRTNGTSAVRVVNLNANGDGVITVGFGSTISRVIVVMTNASARYEDCYSNQTSFACFGGVPLDQDRPYSFRATVI
jgi:hypothetical protein